MENRLLNRWALWSPVRTNGSWTQSKNAFLG